MEFCLFGVLHVDGRVAALERDPVQEEVDLAGVGRRGVHDDLVVAGCAREVVVAGALDGDDSGRLLEASVVVGDGDVGAAEREGRLAAVEFNVVAGVEPELVGFVAGVFSPACLPVDELGLVCCASGESVVAPLEISVRFPSPWRADSCGDTLEELSPQAMMNTDAIPNGIVLRILMF